MHFSSTNLYPQPNKKKSTLFYLHIKKVRLALCQTGLSVRDKTPITTTTDQEE